MNNIKIIGLGGAGIKTISYIKTREQNGLYCIAADFCKNAFSGIKADKTLLLSENASTDELMKKLKLEFDDKVFIVAGLGGKCGRQLAKLAASSIPDIARFYVYMPYAFEGKSRNDAADECFSELESAGVDIMKLDNNYLLNKDAFGGNTCKTIAQAQEKFYEMIYNDISSCSSE